MELITPTLIVSPSAGGTLTIEQTLGHYDDGADPVIEECDYAVTSYIAKPAAGWTFSEFRLTQRAVTNLVKSGVVTDSYVSWELVDHKIDEAKITQRADGSFVWTATPEDKDPSVWWTRTYYQGVPFYAGFYYTRVVGWESSEDYIYYPTELVVTAVFVKDDDDDITQVAKLVVDAASGKLVCANGLLLNGM